MGVTAAEMEGWEFRLRDARHAYERGETKKAASILRALREDFLWFPGLLKTYGGPTGTGRSKP